MLKPFNCLLKTLTISNCVYKTGEPVGSPYGFPWYDPVICFEERVHLHIDEMTRFIESGERVIIPGKYSVYLGHGSCEERSEEPGVQLVTASFTLVPR